MQFCAGRVPSLQHLRVGGGDGVSPKATTFGTKSSGGGGQLFLHSFPNSKIGGARTHTRMHTRIHTHTHTHAQSSLSLEQGQTKKEDTIQLPSPKPSLRLRIWSVNKINKVGDWNVVGEAEDAGNKDA